MNKGWDDFSARPHAKLKPLYDVLVAEDFDVRIYVPDDSDEMYNAQAYGSREMHVWCNGVDVASVYADRNDEWYLSSKWCTMDAPLSEVGVIVAVLKYIKSQRN
jgi:hypothetical protein